MLYKIQNQDISIDLHDHVFTPSPHGTSAIGEAIRISKGESVLDVGTGTGLLAILAAKLGGIVTAVDISEEAVKLTKINAINNNVMINSKVSDLFESLSEKYDVIIANVPQENLSPKIVSSQHIKKNIGMNGGINGNEIFLRMISDAPKYMHKDSRLYLAVYSLSNFRESLREVLKTYCVKLINFYTSPVKDFVYSDIEWYKQQQAEGLIGFYKKGDRYFADIFVFELSLKY